MQLFIQAPRPRARLTAPAPHGRGANVPTFPIFTEALKLATHSDSMVRAGVRTLVLSVVQLRDDQVNAFLTGGGASSLAKVLAQSLKDEAELLDRSMWQSLNNARMDDGATAEGLHEIEDLVCFVNDLLQRSTPPVALVFAEVLWFHLSGPVFLWPLVSSPLSPPSLFRVPVGQPCVRPVIGLYFLERFFHHVSDPRLVNALAGALLLGSAHPVAWLALQRHDAKRMLAPVSPKNPQAPRHRFRHYSSILGDESGNAVPTFEYLESLVALLSDSGSSPQVRSGVLRCLIALICNTNVDMDLLDSANMLPQKLKKTKEMINLLLKHGGGDTATIYSSSDVRSVVQRQNGSYHLQVANSRRDADDDASAASRIEPIRARQDSSVSMDVDALLGAVVHLHLEGPKSSKPGARGSSTGPGSVARSMLEAELEDNVEAICLQDELLRLLESGDMPPSMVAMLGWLLRQLLLASKRGRGPSILKPGRKAILDKVLATAQANVSKELTGPFADCVPVMVHYAWQECRSRIVSPQLNATPLDLLWPAACGRQGMEGLPPNCSGVCLTAERVQQLVTIVQTYQLLVFGRISKEAPIVGSRDVPHPALASGGMIDLPPEAVPAKVSFKPNEVLSVRLFTTGSLGRGSVVPGPALADAPMLLIAHEPAPGEETRARITSLAPLLGSFPRQDPKRGDWLHVHIRPHVHSISKACRQAFVGSSGRVALKRHYLAEGNWVMACDSAEAVRASISMIELECQRMRQQCAQIMAPLLSADAIAEWGHGIQGGAREGEKGSGDDAGEPQLHGEVAAGDDGGAGAAARPTGECVGGGGRGVPDAS